MPNVGLFDSICSGHDCFPPSNVIQASGDVIIENRGCARITDAVQVHCCVSCHGRNIAQGSNLVIVNNLKCAYLGAAINCGGNVVSNVAQTVFCGI